ncbi:unnamed protein product [Closterium sp. NIES-54]
MASALQPPPVAATAQLLPQSRPYLSRPSRPLPCSRPMSRPCPAAAPVMALPSPLSRPLPYNCPCRGPALLPPLSRPCPAAAHCRGLAFAARRGPYHVAALCRGPALQLPLSRPCPAPAPGKHLRCPAAPRCQEPSRAALPSRAAQPSRAAFAEPRCPSACPASVAFAATAAMASPTVLTFDAEGRAVDFDPSRAAFAEPRCPSACPASAAFAATAAMASPTVLTFDAEGRAVDFDWTTRDAVARLAVRSHLSPAERAHFGQYKTAQSLYDAVVAHYSSPATAALSRLMLPYLFPDLAAFARVADLIAHLRTRDACYRAALPTNFCTKNPPPMYITLYYLVTRLPDSLSSVRDHFLSLCPTELTVDLLEERLAAAEKSILARLPLVGGTAIARARGGRVVEGTAGATVEAVEEAEGVAVEVGVVPGVGASVAVVEVVEAAAEVVEAAAAVVEATAVVVGVAAAVVLVEVQPRSVEALVVASASSSRVPVRPRRPSSFVSGTLGVGGLGFPDAVELPRWHDLLRQNVALFDLDFDAILAAMYALTDSAEGDYYLSVPPDPGIEAAALGASASASQGAGESALSDIAPIEALHTFTLDSGASRSFFRDSTTLTPLSRPVAVSLADPSRGPVFAHSSTVLPCPAAPSGLLSGLHLPSFSTNLVSGSDLQDAWVDQFAPGGQRMTHCTCSRTGRHLATFTRQPRSSLYTLTTAPPPVSASGQVAASSQVFAAASRSSPVFAPCSCRPLSHETLLWHHRLGHPSLPRLRGMASVPLSRVYPSPSIPFLQGLPLLVFLVSRAGSAPLLTAPRSLRQRLLCRLFTWTCGAQPTSVDRVTSVTSCWSLTTTRVTPQSSPCAARVRSLRGGEFSSDLLRAFCRAEGIRQTFTLPASPQQNGIAERRIGMVMDVARTSMIHAAAPHFLWPFAVQYAAHQINLQPRVSLPETTPTLRWTGKIGDASAFHVWGSRAFVRDTSADKLSSRAVPCVFLGFPPDAPGWQFYHPTSCCVLSSQDVTFDESVSYYRLFPYRDPLPPQGPDPSGVSRVDPAEPVEVTVDSGAARGAEPAGAGTRGAKPGGAEPERVESGGAEPAGAEPGGGEPERVESGGAEPERVEPGGAEPGGTASWGAEHACAESGGSPGVPLRWEPLSPQRLLGAGAAGGATSAGAARAAGPRGARTRGTIAAGAGGAAGVCAAGTRAAGAGATRGAAGAGAAGAAGRGGARTGGTRAAGAGGVAGGGATGTGAGGAAGAVIRDPGAEGTGAVSGVSGGAARSRPYYVPLLQQVLAPSPPLLSSSPVQSQSHFQPAPPLPGPSPYSRPTRGLTERHEPESRPVLPDSRPASPESRSESPVRTFRAGRRVSHPRPPPVPGTHSMTLRPSTAPQHVPLPSPRASSLPDGSDPESDSLRAASPTVTRFLATAVTDPLFESAAASALVAELVDFGAACRLDYATSLVAGSASTSVCPLSVGGEGALSTDVLEDRQEEFECFAAAVPPLVSMLLAPEGDPDAPDIPTPRSYAEAIEGPYSSQWQAATDAEMASWKSTRTYFNEVPPPGANIVSGMWIFRVKWLPGSPPVFKARYVARGFRQGQGVDFFNTFSPTPKMTTLRVLLHVAAQRDHELHSLDFSTAFLQGSLLEEIWLRRPPGFTGSFRAGTQWSLRRPVYGLRQAPREWHDTLRTTLAALGFAPSTADPSLFLRTDTTLSPFYVLVYVDDLIFATADTEALAHVKSELQKRHTCTDLAPPLDESVEPSGPYPELVGYLMYLMTCTRPDLAYPLSLLARYVAPGRHRKVHWDAAKRVLRYLCSTLGMGLVLGGRARVVLTGHADASWADDLATQRSSQGYTFSLGSGSVSWQSTRSSSVLSSSCEAEIYAGAMAAQELRWLTYLLTDLGEAPRSPPVMYVNNKAMLALCQEHRLENRTKHIALRYFLALELQQRGQLRLAYVASRANTADVFTKALQPCDHQPFCTVLGLVPTVPHLLTS